MNNYYDNFDLNKPEEFKDFLHSLTPIHQDDAMGGVFGIKLGKDNNELERDNLDNLDNIKELSSKYDFIIINYGNSAGDRSVTYVNLRTMKTFSEDENPLK